MADVTTLAASSRQRRFDPVAELWTEFYDELKRLARSQLRRRLHSATVSTTDLLHDASMSEPVGVKSCRQIRDCMR